MLENIDSVGGGLHKHWIYSTKVQYELVCDYLQKINYSIQDYNRKIKNIRGREDICFLILIATWIKEAYEQIEKAVCEDVRKAFAYKDDSQINVCKEYINALRAFVVAHPLSTSRHEKYGLDGDYICVDISAGPVEGILKAVSHYGRFYYLSINGLNSVDSLDQFDYRLYVYSKKENAEFFKCFGCSLADLEVVAKAYIDKLKAFDKYMSHQKKKQYFQ